MATAGTAIGVGQHVAVMRAGIEVVGMARGAERIRKLVRDHRAVLPMAAQALAQHAEEMIARIIRSVHIALQGSPCKRAVARTAFLAAENKVIRAAPGCGCAVVALAAGA